MVTQFFETNWLQIAEAPVGAPRIQAWDIGSQEAFGATFAMHDDKVHLVDVKMSKAHYPRVKYDIATWADFHHPALILIDDLLDRIVITDLLRDTGLPVAPVSHRGERRTAMADRLNEFRKGLRSFPIFADPECPHLDEVRLQMLQFPTGSSCKAVNTIERYARWLKNRSARRERIRGL